MRRLIRPLMAFALLATVAGCASSGANSGQSMMRADMGRLLAGPLAETREKVWSRHQIPVYREQRDFQRIVWESSWMARQPTPAEQAEGVERAQNQVIIRGRRIEEGLDSEGTVFRVTFEVHNQVQTNLKSEWHPATIPPEVEERFRAVLRDMEIELRTGVRR